MLYPPITLRRDGAFMLCEDASEFDTNYDAPQAPAEVAKVEIVQLMAEKDPLDKFADKMSVLYDQIVEPMMNMDFSFDNPRQAIDACEKLSSDTSTIFNVMRIKLTKFAGIVCGGLTEDLAKESFNSHAGLFMKNAAMIKQQGIESYAVNWKENPAFANGWSLECLVDVVSAKPDILREMIYEPELNALLGNENYLRNFNGFVDLMQCVFKDRARLERLSADTGFNLTFQSLLMNAPETFSGDTSYRAKTNQKLIVKYLTLLSSSLREISRASYEMQLGLVDGTATPEAYEKCIRPLITKVVNLFGIGMAIGCYFATALQCDPKGLRGLYESAAGYHQGTRR